MKYDFTGKERDDQTTYDYFGARYYDSRVANWTSIDPLFEKHYDHSPFNYVLRNPIRMIDPDGKQVDITSPMYHINKETGKIQLQVTEFHKDLNYASKKAEPYLKVALNYTRKVALGVMLNEQFGLTKNIPLVSIYKPNLLTFAVLVGTILHVTAPDLNKNEPDYSERNEKDMRSSEIEELYNHYTKTESKGSKKDNNKIGIMPGKAITTIIQNYNKLGF